jgi:hypothetical protein
MSSTRLILEAAAPLRAADPRVRRPRFAKEHDMTIPTVTEIPGHLQPTSPDPFRDFEPERLHPAAVIRELDGRHSDGIDVRLLWNQTADQIVVSVFDAKTGDAFAIEVEASEALDAFRHPYAHAAFRGNRKVSHA